MLSGAFHERSPPFSSGHTSDSFQGGQERNSRTNRELAERQTHLRPGQVRPYCLRLVQCEAERQSPDHGVQERSNGRHQRTTACRGTTPIVRLDEQTSRAESSTTRISQSCVVRPR
jgi:hypothetical protein